MTDASVGGFEMTADMRRVVEEQRLGFVASVCPDGTPNLSPKGTTSVWDDHHLVFADIRSPRTVRNVRSNPWVEVNVVDPVSRRGYRFKGTARVLEGDEHEAGIRFFETGERAVSGARERIDHVVLVQVSSAAPVTSPSYDVGATEESLRARWRAYFERLWSGETS
ncbi:MAG TPA: pyridoxamine 5'-phosphate oxidase family protein [Actinomycetota bacterium]|nr:pyridoxamine 5'-phosphate oxidase family protein [Actinomycetota bacterium]